MKAMISNTILTQTRLRVSALLLLSLFLTMSPALLAQNEDRVELEPGISADLSVDWRLGSAVLNMRRTVSAQERFTPALRAEYLHRIERLLPRALIDTLSPLPINSNETFGSRCREDTGFTEYIAHTARSATRTQTYFSRELSSFEAHYRLSLFPSLVQPLISHSSAHNPPPLLEYVPTGNYSGIVIYVEEELPLFGTERKTTFSPSLLPRILDPELQPLIQAKMVTPEALRTRGMAAVFGYAEMDMLPTRVGDVPYYTSAEAVFGVNRTDLVVSGRAARRIRASDHMYRLIREGKLAIVCKLPTR